MNNLHNIDETKKFLKNLKSFFLSDEQRIEKTIQLATFLQDEARKKLFSKEKIRALKLAKMMNDPSGKEFVTEMTDQCFRSQSYKRVANQLQFLISQFSIPKFLFFFEKILFFLFKSVGHFFPSVTIPIIQYMIRKESCQVIIPGEEKELFNHLNLRKSEGLHINLNHIGEAILGEKEALHRLKTYIKDLSCEKVECVSIKISTIFSQINLLDWEGSLLILSVRLRELYRAAKKYTYIGKEGEIREKFVYLDMEEYKDLNLTVALFKKVLSEPEFLNYSAGIVLQSYLPDSFSIQKDLTAFAIKRTQALGAPIKLRLVKGANLSMEKVEASIKKWPQTPYLHKIETDANFKKMINYGCQLENIESVNLKIGSHNCFDIAYGMILRSEKNIEPYLGFEMLEGMAPSLARIVQELTNNLLLYCPVAKKKEFPSAVAYLTRRLDENTSEENYLRHAFEMETDSLEWKNQTRLFTESVRKSFFLSEQPNRDQNRQEIPSRKKINNPFANEPDTDFSLKTNIEWGNALLKKSPLKKYPPLYDLKLDYLLGIDPSFPDKELYRFSLSGTNELEKALEKGTQAFLKWSKKPLIERFLLIDEVENQLRIHREDLILALCADVGKSVQEGDSEVSEAIDFASFYKKNIQDLYALKDIRWEAKGLILVTPPWNFPCSITAGGIIASLVAGNTVIVKPAPEAVLVVWHLVNLMWKAGVSQEVLQFFCCLDEPIGSLLIKDERIKAVILTGGTVTAKLFFKLRPKLTLFAETGGKNTLIITKLADRDLSIKDLIFSAFHYAGQKCSACSLAIIEEEVYFDETFRRQIVDAASSMKVGSAWDPSSRITPLIKKPEKDLLRALTTLEEGEEWLLKPVQDNKNLNLWSPGIKIGVTKKSFTSQTEFFGPILGIMCAKNLEEAITLANDTPYGLTAGIHSLDIREQIIWKNNIIAGNLYINRSITGAIVQRQPFGGCKESSFGRGGKAGGINYVLQLMNPIQKTNPLQREKFNMKIESKQEKYLSRDEIKLLEASIESYQFYWNHLFSKIKDPSKLLGQDNQSYYVPRSKLTVRIKKNEPPLNILQAAACAFICQTLLEISLEEGFDGYNLSFLNHELIQNNPFVTILFESEVQLNRRSIKNKETSIRFLSEVNEIQQRLLTDANCRVIIAPILANGRLELLHYLREVSLSKETHRYGYTQRVSKFGILARPVPLI